MTRASFFCFTALLGACDRSPSESAHADPAPSVSSAVLSAAAPPSSSGASSIPTMTDSAVASPATVNPSPSLGAETSVSSAKPAITSHGVGMHVDAKYFSVDIASPSSCIKGAECSLAVTLTAKDDFHVNKDYPYKLKMEDTPQIAFLGTDGASPSTFSKAAGDFAFVGEKNGTMTVRYRGSNPGTASLRGLLKLSVCNASNCQLEQANVTATVPILDKR